MGQNQPVTLTDSPSNGELVDSRNIVEVSLMKRNRLQTFRVGLVLAVLTSLVVLGSSGASAQIQRHAASAHFKHVIVIMMENTGFGTLIGDKNAPWINAAAQKYLVAGDYYGVTHPSQPNYIAATSGSLNGINSDNDHASLIVPNIVSQLTAKHLTWRAYMQSLNLCLTGVASPSTIAGETKYKFDHACGDAHYGAQLYERKHDPFVTYDNVASSPAQMANIVDFTKFAKDLKHAKTFPNYAWISPDQCHDMHGVAAPTKSDPCDFSQIQNTIAIGDTFLKQTVKEIVHSSVWKDKTAIFITWDEADFTGGGFQGFGDDTGCCDSVAGQGGGHVLTMVITSTKESKNGQRVSLTPDNHFSMLSAIEKNWHLGCIANTCDTANVKPMTGLR